MKRQAAIVVAIAVIVLLGAGMIIGLVISRATVIAELIEASGAVQSQHGAASSWEQSPRSDRYRLGDAVRTGPHSTARVRMRAGGGIDLRPRTTVRFSAARPGSNAPAIRIEQGEIEIEAENPLSLAAGAGIVRVDRGSRVRLTAEGPALRLRVELGRAVVERDGAPNATLTEGVTELFALDPRSPLQPSAESVDAGVTIERRDAAASAVTESDARDLTVEDAANDGASTGAASDDNDASLSASAARPSAGAFVDAPADMSVGAGESASIHAPVLPVRVRVDVRNRCPSDAQASITVRGTTHETRVFGAITVELPSGAHALRVRCEGSRAVLRSTLAVDSATGAAALPSRPAQSEIAIDGHDYTVLYQNLLPVLRVQWPGAPASSEGYTLTVRDARGREQSIEARAPAVTLSSGQVRDGTVRLSMRARSGGARSPESTVSVQFDNDANTAQIRAPRPNEALSGTVSVEGTALEGSAVTVGNTAMALDSQRRFQGEIALGAAPALVIMIRHRSSGTHYYVRRAAP